MSYMTPYYFTGSAGQSISIWMRSSDFIPKVGLTYSGSTTKLAEAELNAWEYDSPNIAAAITMSLPSSSYYKIECSSDGATDTGSFSLYVTSPQTSSLVSNNTSDLSTLRYSPTAKRMWVIDSNGSALSANVSIINPLNNAITNNYNYSNTAMFDIVYNSTSESMWVWVSGSGGEFLQEYNASGSALITSHSLGTKNWHAQTTDFIYGQMAYDPVHNNILLVPRSFSFSSPPSYSIYNCSTNAVIASGSCLSNQSSFCAYVSSSHEFYIFTADGTTAGLRINTTTFTSASVPNMTGSGFGFGYIAEVDRLFFENDTATSCSVFNPNTNQMTNAIPGIQDFLFITFDPCQNCLIISDDGAGGFSDGGGLCYVITGSYTPGNFIHYFGPWSIAYSNVTSTTFATNYNIGAGNQIISVFSQIPTGSLPQPALPVAQPPVVPSFCVIPSFQSFLYTGSISSPITKSFTSNGTGSLSVWARSTAFTPRLNAYLSGGGTVGTAVGTAWTPTGDVNNAGLNIPISQSTTFNIQLTSSNGTYGTGNYQLYLSPGSITQSTWPNRFPLNPSYISASNIVAVACNQARVVFYNVSSSTLVQNYRLNAVYGGGYSETQQKYFVYGNDGTNNSIIEYDNNGTFVATRSIAPYTRAGLCCYDSVNDRLFLFETLGSIPNIRYALWSCASRTTIRTSSISQSAGTPAYCTYAAVNNRYYTSWHNLSNNVSMIWVDASTFVTGATSTQMHDYLQYEPSTKQIAATSANGVILINPSTDTVTSTITSDGSHIFEGVAFDPCIQGVVLCVDFNAVLNSGGLIVVDPSSSYAPFNFIQMYNSSSNFMYGICQAMYDSKMYITTDSFNTLSSSLWSCKVTKPSASISYP